jgi:hypothetical protein
VIIIRPERVFARIEGELLESLDEKTLPEEFKLDFKIMNQALLFNMIDDQDIGLIIEGIWTIIDNIQEMVAQSGKSEYKESVYFPFEKHTDRSRASMIIDFHYRSSGNFTSPRITISRE